MDEELLFEIPFTQYLLPDGRKKEILWECTDMEVSRMARDIIEAGLTFECEVLNNGFVSLSVEDLENDEQVGIQLSSNDGKISGAVDKLIRRVHERINKKHEHSGFGTTGCSCE